MPDSLRPATPGPHGKHAHRQQLITPRRSVRARIDGRWITAVAVAQRQNVDGGPWEICLEYATGPGQNRLGWFVVDDDNLISDEAE